MVCPQDAWIVSSLCPADTQGAYPLASLPTRDFSWQSRPVKVKGNLDKDKMI